MTRSTKMGSCKKILVKQLQENVSLTLLVDDCHFSYTGERNFKVCFFTSYEKIKYFQRLRQMWKDLHKQFSWRALEQ